MNQDALPSHLRHLNRANPKPGRSRDGRGLFLRGVVTAVYRPGEGTDRMPVSSAALPGIVVDVRSIEPGYLTTFRNVPVLVQSGGLNDYEQWTPRAASVGLGRAIDSTTPMTDTDGDVVVIGFLGGDLNQPAIFGQLPHPKTNRAPSAGDEFVYRRRIRGIDFGVGNTGDVDIDLSTPGNGVVSAAGVEGVGTGGDLTLTFAAGRKAHVLKAIASDPEAVILGETFLTDLQTSLVELSSAVKALGIPTPSTDTLVAKIVSSLASGPPYLSLVLETD